MYVVLLSIVLVLTVFFFIKAAFRPNSVELAWGELEGAYDDLAGYVESCQRNNPSCKDQAIENTARYKELHNLLREASLALSNRYNR